jgi:hypothetical protein
VTLTDRAPRLLDQLRTPRRALPFTVPLLALALVNVLTVVAVPALLVFSIGQAFDRSEEGMEDELCAMSGYAGGSDALAEEADDSVDPTPDCAGGAQAS